MWTVLLFVFAFIMPSTAAFFQPAKFIMHHHGALVVSSSESILQLSHDDGYEDDEDEGMTTPSSCNVLGTALIPCCTNVRGTGIGTGFYRNGYCSTGDQDLGRHTVCVSATDDFLQFSAAVGNDLSTPVVEYLFPGLKEGDLWCLCASRYAQAYKAGMAPKVILQATHEKTLDYVPLEVLMEYAIDREESEAILNRLNSDRERLNRML